MDVQNNSAVAHAPSDDPVETAVVSLVATSNDAVAQALRIVYTNLPGDVVRQCERHRIGATSDYLRHMRAVRDALAPYGAFKDWSEAQGIPYTALQKALSRRFGEVAPDTRQRHDKLPADAASTAGLSMGAAKPMVAGEAADHDAQTAAGTRVNAGDAAATTGKNVAADDTFDDTVDNVAADDDGSDSMTESMTESMTRSETADDAADAVRSGDSGVTLEDSARVLTWEFTEFRRSFGAFRAAFHERPDLSATDLETWWRTIDADEWVSAVETYRWFMDATQSYRAFMASHYHLQPPMANMHATLVSLTQEAPHSARVSSARAIEAITDVAADELEDTIVDTADHAYEVADDAGASERDTDVADLAMLQREADAAYNAWQAAAACDPPADFAEVSRLWEVWDALSYRLAIATKTVSA